MKAVNLIPEDSRRSSTPAGRSGGAAHAVLGLLALAVLAVALLTLTGRQVEERRAELTRLEAEAQAVEARAGLLGPYREFADLAQARTTRVRDLAAARVDWSFTLTEVARVLPRGVRLTALTATTAPGAGGGGGGNALRAALPNPAVELTGCAPSQEHTALLLSRLRAIDGVERVALSTSEKADQEQGGAAPAAAAGEASDASDCRAGSDRIPQFSVVVFLRQTPAASAAGAASGTAAAPATGATPATSTTTQEPTQ